MISEPNTWVLIALALAAPVLSLAMARTRAMFAIAMILAALSLIAALALTALDAPDLALIQALLGLGVVTPLFLGAASLTGKAGAARRTNWPMTAAAAVLALLLAAASVDVPVLGEAHPGAGQGALVYVNRAAGEAGLQNAVTAVSANYRAFDSLLAAGAVFLACLGAYAVLGFGERTALRRPPSRPGVDTGAGDGA
jgi:multisubunit Na+/H+ antiporter MnhB subunit